jgi:hypothetical protein
MDLERLRRYAQIALAVVAIASAAGAGYRYLTRGGSPFGEHIVHLPDSGPVGTRAFFEFPGFDDGQEIAVYLCAGAAVPIGDCAELGKGKAGDRLRGKPIPKALPEGTKVDPGTYVLRAGPASGGQFPQRGTFEVVAFKVGKKPRSVSFAGVDPARLQLGEPKQIARGTPCRPPVFLADGRLVVGTTVFDPKTSVTIDTGIVAQEMTWSPVGDKLALITPDRKEIQLAAPDGSSPVTVKREARGFVSSLSWSPQGDRLAFIAAPDPAVRQLEGDPRTPTVKIINATNRTETAAGPGLAVSWSPAGDTLAVEMSGAVIQASTPEGGRRELTTGRIPSWSWDGRFLNVIRTTASSVKEGFIAATEGSAAAPVVGQNVCAHAFAPDGKSIAVVRDEGGQQTLVLRTVRLPGQEGDA